MSFWSPFQALVAELDPQSPGIWNNQKVTCTGPCTYKGIASINQWSKAAAFLLITIPLASQCRHLTRWMCWALEQPLFGSNGHKFKAFNWHKEGKQYLEVGGSGHLAQKFFRATTAWEWHQTPRWGLHVSYLLKKNWVSGNTNKQVK